MSILNAKEWGLLSTDVEKKIDKLNKKLNTLITKTKRKEIWSWDLRINLKLITAIKDAMLLEYKKQCQESTFKIDDVAKAISENLVEEFHLPEKLRSNILCDDFENMDIPAEAFRCYGLHDDMIHDL